MPGMDIRVLYWPILYLSVAVIFMTTVGWRPLHQLCVQLNLPTEGRTILPRIVFAGVGCLGIGFALWCMVNW